MPMVEGNSSCRWGVVIIGRNEGERLKICISSARKSDNAIVYVDSGSSDGSSAWARTQGVEVVDLDMARPFTAARARNEGFHRLLAVSPGVEFVQFIDGDCEFRLGWLEEAAGFLAGNAGVATVCGRLREKFPEASIFNAQCDREWNTRVGEARACGGIAMFRRKAFEQVHGFRSDLIAGEEPELCVRLRAAGWKIWRADLEMAWHDAAIMKWTQWWKRSRRAGYAYAEGAWLHGAPPELHWVTQTVRAIFWGMIVPCITAGASVFLTPWFLLIMLLYPLQIVRIAYRSRILDRVELQQATLMVIGKIPEAIGAFGFWLKAAFNRPPDLIEYK